MQTVKEHFFATLEVKQSKFIAHLIPYTLYEATLQQLKQEHPKARHFVTASRYLNEFSQIVEHSSDDGEPKGTSGKPSLMVLQGQDLINVAVIIVRYFGGTKLGTGGLVRAYSDAVNLVISEASLVEYKEEIVKNINFDYSNIRLVDYECEEFGITVVEKSFEDRAFYVVKAAKEPMQLFLKKLNRVVEISSIYQE
jgi:uncharacterized YigZ family protein